MTFPEIVGVRDAKVQLGKYLSEVERGRVYQIVKYGRAVAILIGSEQYKTLLQELEDLEDAVDALQAMQEPSRSLDEFTAGLNAERAISAGD